MITTAFKVRLAHNIHNGLSETQPDVNFDSNKGYYAGFILLVTDGTLWVCSDPTVGAAVWDQDTSDDIAIDLVIRDLTDIVTKYLDNLYVDPDAHVSVSNPTFVLPDRIQATGARFDEYFLPGDTLGIVHSRRNDGYYDITAVTATEITVTPNLKYGMTEKRAVGFLGSVYPDGLQDIAGAMGSYDLWTRPTLAPGLKREAIGTYNYERAVDIGGVDYPVDVTAGLMQYKRPKVR